MKRQLITLGVIAALVFAAGAPAAKQPKPARVQASVDFIAINLCEPTPQYGHLEISAFDDDLVPTFYSWERQNDRVQVKVTWANGLTWEPNALGVEMLSDGQTAYIGVDSWWDVGWMIRDGGNPGTAPSGVTFNDVAGTVDWARFKTWGTCNFTMYFLTGGNIKITPAS